MFTLLYCATHSCVVEASGWNAESGKTWFSYFGLNKSILWKFLETVGSLYHRLHFFNLCTPCVCHKNFFQQFTHFAAETTPFSNTWHDFKGNLQNLTLLSDLEWTSCVTLPSGGDNTLLRLDLSPGQFEITLHVVSHGLNFSFSVCNKTPSIVFIDNSRAFRHTKSAFSGVGTRRCANRQGRHASLTVHTCICEPAGCDVIMLHVPGRVPRGHSVKLCEMQYTTDFDEDTTASGSGDLPPP